MALETNEQTLAASQVYCFVTSLYSCLPAIAYDCPLPYVSLPHTTFSLKPICNGYKGYSMEAFLKLWFADHKWSSGSALEVLLDLTLVQKDRKNQINVNCVSRTVVENLKPICLLRGQE
jgi:hypothetical protein